MPPPAAPRWFPLLVTLVCLRWSASADRYTAGTLRHYLQEVVVEALATHCPRPQLACPANPAAAPARPASAVATGFTRQSCRETASCTDGFVSCGGRCYRRLGSAVSHEQAERACAQLGGRLAVPRSDHENQCATAFALAHEVWLGVTTDPQFSGHFTGSDGAAVAAVGPYWDAGQPDNYKGEDAAGEGCVVLFPSGWHDRTCRHSTFSMCQQV